MKKKFDMQNVATKIFIGASICFGLVGLTMIFSGNFGPNKSDDIEPSATLLKLLFACVFVILPSFAVSVAGKYLRDK